MTKFYIWIYTEQIQISKQLINNIIIIILQPCVALVHYIIIMFLYNIIIIIIYEKQIRTEIDIIIIIFSEKSRRGEGYATVVPRPGGPCGECARQDGTGRRRLGQSAPVLRAEISFFENTRVHPSVVEVHQKVIILLINK